MKKTAYILFLFFMSAIASFGQYTPDYSQYMFNGLAINPAYTGSREALSTSLLYRKQWVNFEGAPQNITFSAHGPLKNEKIALGLFVTNESYPTSSNTGFYANYAYRININNAKLSFGLKAGIKSVTENFSDVSTLIGVDPAFEEAAGTSFLPNFGGGIYYYTDNYYVGISVPDFLETIKVGDSYTVQHNFSNYNYHLTGGYLLSISDNFKLKPSTLLKYQYGEIQADLNNNFILFNDRLWLGASYRLSKAVVGIIEVQVNNQLKVGYSYDYSLGDLSAYNDGSHEIFLRYEFKYKVETFNPRYF